MFAFVLPQSGHFSHHNRYNLQLIFLTPVFSPCMEQSLPHFCSLSVLVFHVVVLVLCSPGDARAVDHWASHPWAQSALTECGVCVAHFNVFCFTEDQNMVPRDREQDLLNSVLIWPLIVTALFPTHNPWLCQDTMCRFGSRSCVKKPFSELYGGVMQKQGNVWDGGGEGGGAVKQSLLLKEVLVRLWPSHLTCCQPAVLVGLVVALQSSCRAALWRWEEHESDVFMAFPRSFVLSNPGLQLPGLRQTPCRGS